MKAGAGARVQDRYYQDEEVCGLYDQDHDYLSRWPAIDYQNQHPL